jgi:23S rRNA pseudouridine2457 synthase
VKYIVFFKPFEVMPTFTDPAGRPTLKDFVPVRGVYAAGRLDYDSEGLLLLTDDREVIHRVTEPRYDHPKTYLVQVEGEATEAAVEQLRHGVVLSGHRTKPVRARVVSAPELPPRAKPVRAYHPTTWLEVVLREGKKRQLRRMTAAVGLPTLRLVRVGIGPLALKGLGPGQWRWLTPNEVRTLRVSLGLDQTRPAGNRR